MKIPRGASGTQVVALAQRHGYSVVQTRGSHVRLRFPGPPEHNLTIPNHRILKTGTLQGILSEIAKARSLSIESLIAEL